MRFAIQLRMVGYRNTVDKTKENQNITRTYKIRCSRIERIFQFENDTHLVALFKKIFGYESYTVLSLTG